MQECQHLGAEREHRHHDAGGLALLRDGGFATHVLAEAAFCVRLGALADDEARNATLAAIGQAFPPPQGWTRQGAVR